MCIFRYKLGKQESRGARIQSEDSMGGRLRWARIYLVGSPRMRFARAISWKDERRLEKRGRGSMGKFGEKRVSWVRTFGNERATPGMECAKLRVGQNANQIGLRSLVKSPKSLLLKTKVVLEIIGHLLDETMEGSSSDEQVGTLLIAANLTKGNSTRTEAMGLLDSARHRGLCFHSCHAWEHLPRYLSTRELTSSLLGDSHTAEPNGGGELHTEPPEVGRVLDLTVEAKFRESWAKLGPALLCRSKPGW